MKVISLKRDVPVLRNGAITKTKVTSHTKATRKKPLSQSFELLNIG